MKLNKMKKLIFITLVAMFVANFVIWNIGDKTYQYVSHVTLKDDVSLGEARRLALEPYSHTLRGEDSKYLHRRVVVYEVTKSVIPFKYKKAPIVISSKAELLRLQN